MNSKGYPEWLETDFPAKINRLRCVAGFVLLSGVLLWAGCATPSSAPGSQAQSGTGNGVIQDSAAVDSEGPRDAGAKLSSFRPDATASDITALSWGRDGSLRLGYADGKWVQLDARRRDATLHRASKDAHPVVAISATGELAFIGSTPPTIIRLRDHQVVLRLNKVKKMYVGGFFVSGAGFFAAEKSGALHVWRRSEKKLDKASTRDLKRVVMRQSADFSVGLPATRGPWLVTPDDLLVMGTSDGEVLSWKLSAPDQVDTVDRLPAASHSFGLTKAYLVATTVDGALRVSDRSKSVFLPWSQDARGEVVAASEKLDASFAVVEKTGGRLLVGMRDFESGDYRWKSNLEDAEICGFELSPDARQLALCVDSGVLVLDVSSGDLIGAFRRNGESLEWQKN